MSLSPFALCVRRQMLLAGILLTGLPSIAEAAPPDAVSIVNRYVAAWNAHDADAAVATLAPGAVYYNSGADLEQDAKASIDTTLRGLLGILPDLRWRIIGQPIESTSGVAFEWEVSGSYTSNRQAGTKPLHIRGASLFRVRDGHISYLADYYDGASMRRQIGQ